MIQQRSIQEVIETARIEEVVQDYLELKKRGSNLIGLCPFHNEKTPSFTVNPARNIFKCFGCGQGGNTVSFIMEHDHLSFPEAIRHLAGKYNITLEETEMTSEQKDDNLRRESLYIVNEFAKDHFQNQLFETELGRNVALGYFKQRGFRESTMKSFGLGYTDNKPSDLTKSAIDNGFKIEQLRDVGLTNRYDKDFFRDRVMFSLFNVSGKVIGFAGRTLSQDKSIPKYINTPETEIYNKRKTLYGLHLAKTPIRKEDECILVEGYTDVITLYQNGIQNVVAASGTSLTVEQARIIKRYTDNVKFIFDGDPAGVKAAIRGIDIVLEQGLIVRVVILSEGDDPDSSLKRLGVDGFRDFISENADDFILFKTKWLLRETKSDPIKKSLVTRDIVKSIALIPDMLHRSIYIQECSKIMSLDENVLINELNKAIKTHMKTQRNNVQRVDSGHVKRPVKSTDQKGQNEAEANVERTIAALLVKFGDQMYDEALQVNIAQFILAYIEDMLEYVKVDLYKKIIDTYASAVKDGKIIPSTHFTFHQDNEIASFAADIFAQKYEYSKNWGQKHGIYLQSQKAPEYNYKNEAYDAVLRFKLIKMDYLIETSKKMIDEISSLPDEITRLKSLTQHHVELLMKRKELAMMVRQVTL